MYLYKKPRKTSYKALKYIKKGSLILTFIFSYFFKFKRFYFFKYYLKYFLTSYINTLLNNNNKCNGP